MDIKVYFSPNCPVCMKLLDFLKNNSVDFEAVDVSLEENKEEAKHIIDETGDYLVPVIEIDDKVIEGFDEEKLKAELKLK